jgi:hypothetical protein
MLEYDTQSLINKYINIGLNKTQAIKASIIDVDNSKNLEKILPTFNDESSIEIFNKLFLIKKELLNLLNNK